MLTNTASQVPGKYFDGRDLSIGLPVALDHLRYGRVECGARYQPNLDIPPLVFFFPPLTNPIRSELFFRIKFSYSMNDSLPMAAQ